MILKTEYERYLSLSLSLCRFVLEEAKTKETPLHLVYIMHTYHTISYERFSDKLLLVLFF